MRLTRTVGLLAAALLTAGTAAVAAPATAAPKATVSILHAVPDQPVDVYADGDALLNDFKPGTLTDPMPLPAGTYDLKVVAAGDQQSGPALIQANDVRVPAGANATVVAHLDGSGKPMLTPFANDVSKVAAGQARLTVRHTAAAPAVDVRADGRPVFEDLENPDEASAEVPAGTVRADVTLAGTDQVAIGPADVNLAEGTNTIVYAWGSAKDKNLQLATQTIEGLHSAPHGVPGGTGGPVETTGASPEGWAIAVTVAGVFGLAASVARLARSRRPSYR